ETDYSLLTLAGPEIGVASTKAFTTQLAALMLLVIAKYWFEQLIDLPCQVEIASEFRYRTPVIVNNTLYVCISPVR
ncbi:hypothetical protein BUV99_12565, partial [Corynebacterium diphtheriae]